MAHMNTAQSEQERLLSILHTHGQEFLSAFNIPTPKGSDSDSSESEEEWIGFSSSSDTSLDRGSDLEQEDDNFVGSSSYTPDVMVFLDPTQKHPRANPSVQELRKSFMSSKVSNVTSPSIQPISKGRASDEESDNERTNAQNDALLHRLVHTKLLSGSLNTELDLNHAQKGRALAGRVLELTGGAKLGKGENILRQEQRSKAAKRVRDGLIRKQRRNQEIALEEAKNLGNYHPTLKQLYDSNPPTQKKRSRGLGMGVGRFVGGTLRLSRNEIASVTGSENRMHDSRRRTHKPLR